MIHVCTIISIKLLCIYILSVDAFHGRMIEISSEYHVIDRYIYCAVLWLSYIIYNQEQNNETLRSLRVLKFFSILCCIVKLYLKTLAPSAIHWFHGGRQNIFDVEFPLWHGMISKHQSPLSCRKLHTDYQKEFRICLRT